MTRACLVSWDFTRGAVSILCSRDDRPVYHYIPYDPDESCPAWAEFARFVQGIAPIPVTVRLPAPGEPLPVPTPEQLAMATRLPSAKAGQRGVVGLKQASNEDVLDLLKGLAR